MATVPSFQLDPLPLPLDLFSGDRQIIILPLEEKRRNSNKKKPACSPCSILEVCRESKYTMLIFACF